MNTDSERPGTDESETTRRGFLKSSASAALGGSLAAEIPAASRTNRSGVIPDENAKEGAHDWQLTRVRIAQAKGIPESHVYRSPWTEGYCSRQSVETGEVIDFMISADPPSRFLIEVFRTGYYGGRGACLMTTLGPIQGTKQPDPPVIEGQLRECRWEASTKLRIPNGWPSGVYLGRLITIPESDDQPY